MKTKLYSLFFLAFFPFLEINGQCPPGDVQLLSQDHVNYFVNAFPNCTHITGNLIFGADINGGGTNDINDITGFENLLKIDGFLGVFYTNLISLNGLNNLNELGSLNIVANNQLTNINELINLTELSNGQLQIAWNYSLQSLQGLNNIQSINGRLYLGNDNNSLTSLAGLNNLTHIGGGVFINGTHLTSLDGLNNLTSVDEWMTIYHNNQLASIEALQNLVFVGGRIAIGVNPQLTSLNGLQNVDPESFGGEENGLSIKDNDNLSTCNLPNICEYLSFDSAQYPREITGNTGNCTNEQTVLAACGMGINDLENDAANWNVVFQKQTGSLLIQSNGFKMAEITIYDLSGNLLKNVVNLNSNREELNVFTPDSILIVKVKTQEGEMFAKKIMMK